LAAPRLGDVEILQIAGWPRRHVVGCMIRCASPTS
jgi:hypothetical protein